MFILFRKAIILTIIILLPINSYGEQTRIKDIATVEGVRDNYLVGEGLVAGLNGSGDNLNNSVFTHKGLTDFLERLGINIQGANLKTKNIAAVTVTANLPPFARRGAKIDVKVSAIGDAKSLKGGTLLATPLLGADGNVYALAQGAISIPEFIPASSEVKTKSNTIETNGYIQNGAIVEHEIDFRFTDLSHVKFSLNSPDFNTVMAIVNAINNNISGNTANALDAATIKITVPNDRKQNMIEFIAEIERLPIKPDYTAKIVINEATGTVVIGDKVNIRPVAISQGNLVVNIAQLEYDKLNPLMTEEQQDLINKFVDDKRGRSIHELKKGATLSELVTGLNKLGVWPRDIINILYSMKSVGAIDAIIEVK